MKFVCDTDADRKRIYYWDPVDHIEAVVCCPGGVPIRDYESSSGWICWWCGGECNPPQEERN